MNELIAKIESGSAVVGIMGLGYVGLPLAMAFSSRFKVVGFDVSKPTVERLPEANPTFMISHLRFCHKLLVGPFSRQLNQGISQNAIL